MLEFSLRKKISIGAGLYACQAFLCIVTFRLITQINQASPGENVALCIAWLNTSIFSVNLLLFLSWNINGATMSIPIILAGSLQTIIPFLAGVPDVTALANLVFLGLTAFTAYAFRHRTQAITHRLRRNYLDLEESLNALKAERDELKHGSAMLHQRLERFPRLRATSEKLAQNLEKDHILDILVEDSLSLIHGAEAAEIFFADAESANLLLKRFLSVHPEERAETISGDEADKFVFRQMKPYLCENTATDRFPQKKTITRMIGSYIATPMLAIRRMGDEIKTECLGVLRVDSRHPRALSRLDLDILNILARLGTVALQNADAFKHAEDLAIRDSLTNLFLPHYFRERCATELSRAQRDRDSLSIIMIDVDYFKKYNDTYGHQAGDQVLIRVARLVNAHVTSDGISGRYGGEEFIIMHPYGKESAFNLSETLRKDIRAMEFNLGDIQTRVTVSIGIATFPEDAREMEALIQRADEALYESKAHGRNRTTGYGAVQA